MGNKKTHLLFKERFCIEKMLKAGKSFGEIAKTLGRGLSTISEEVNANGGRDNYDARKAQIRANFKQYRKKRNCNKVAMDSHLYKFVEKKLILGWSPERISLRLKHQSGLKYASFKSIRKFIQGRHGLERFLFWNRNNHKSGRKRKKESYLNDIERKWIDSRTLSALYEYGHWEGDFIISKYNSLVLLVLVEKFSKTILLRILPNRKNDLVNETIGLMLKNYSVKSLTLDNDIAFSKWKKLEKIIKAPIYFCHPYHSWEKGLVENSNRWIRQFIPKKSNLAFYSEKDIKWIEDWFNHTPRQCLDGKTPYEIMMEKECNKVVESLEINLPTFVFGGKETHIYI
jgi:IS30 family transposase